MDDPKTKNELRQDSEERLAFLASIVESSQDAIIGVNLKKEISSWNTGAETLFGYSKKEALGMQATFLAPPIEKSKTTQILKEIFEGNCVKDLETQRVHKDGSLIDVSLSVWPHLDSNGRIIGSAAIIKDIRERKAMERQLLHSQKMELIGNLAGGIAHDFNNILGSILGYTELLLGKIPQDSNNYQYVKNILQSSERGAELAKQILTFSHPEQQQRIPLSLIVLVEEVLQIIAVTLPEHIEIQSDIPTDAPPILADPTQMHQVILNLCTNAIHAMEEKGGRFQITLQTANGIDFQPHLSKETEYLKLTLQDTGHGIPEEIRAHIFEPFFTTKIAGKGTGLGLAIVDRIVTRHEGKIFVESVVSQGTTFTLLFPIIAQEAHKTTTRNAALTKGHEHLLVVDDEPLLIELFQNALQDQGYQVTATIDPFQALDLFSNNPDQFDLVITDQAMPFLTGQQLSLECLKIKPDLPIILITGYSSHFSKAEALSMGIHQYLTKPLKLRELFQVIRETLD